MAINLIEAAKAKVRKLLDLVPPVQAYNLVKQAAQPVRNFITDLPANVGYVQSKVAQKVLPKYTMFSPEQEIKADKDFPSVKGFYFDLDGGPTKSMSAELNQYPVAPDTPQARFMEKVKKKVIATGGYRPAMQRYLSTIPVSTFRPNQQFAGVANTSRPTSEGTPWEYSYGGGAQPTIGMALPGLSESGLKKMENNLETMTRLKFHPYLEQVMSHELAHTAPRNKAFKTNFKKFFGEVKPETSPMLYEVGLRYYQNGQPPPNEEEFYATLAGEMGPEVLNIPEIRKYYENIFQ